MKWSQITARVAALWRGLSLWGKYAVVAIAAIFVIGFGYLLQGRGASQVTETPRLRAVQVASVSDLQNDTTPLPLIGEVRSLNEAEIRVQAGGAVRKLYYQLGSYVSAGTVIAEVENASQRAALLQAEGALEAAQASVQKSDKLYGQSRTSALNTIKSAYSSNDDLVRSKLDVVFSNPDSYIPRYVLSVSDQSLLNKIETARLRLTQILNAETKRSETLTESSDIKAELQAAIDDTRIVKSYIDDLSALLNVSIASETYSASTISGFVTAASVARTTVSATLAGLTAASQALISAQTESETPSEISSADATIKQAQGAVDAARANLENTIIRAPISGTLNNLSISLGDFVSAYQQVAVVSNNGALEILGHVTAEDRSRLAVGSKVKIENQYDGVVTSIAPAVDPVTKKIEIKVGFSGAANLTNGESVHIDISRSSKATPSKSAVIVIPISAVKVGTEASYVFSVNPEHKLVAHAVKTGDLIGDKIQIVSGVTSEMMLVTDARGLKDGQVVDLQ